MLIGDRVLIDSEGSEHDGREGWLSCVDSGALYYVATNDRDDLLGPFCRNELREVTECECCTRAAVVTVNGVPLCGPCSEQEA